jgi:hypothetical protein
LPPGMLVFYKPHIDFLTEHATDPDKRRYVSAGEGARHFIDIDHYGSYPFDSLPRQWMDAVKKYSADSLNAYGIVPWWIGIMERRLTDAFRDKDETTILKVSAEIGHYIADAHVPLHTSSNHDGQLSGQRGIHAFWESRLPELLADSEWDFFIGHAEYISSTGDFIWKRVLESAALADTVLKREKQLSENFPGDQKFSYEERNGKLTRQYSSAYTRAYDNLIRGMVEKRMRQSVFAVASCWYTAWVNAGQPDLAKLSHKEFTKEEINEFDRLNDAWKNNSIKGREHE